MIQNNIGYSIEMQELLITYPTRIQIKEGIGKENKRRLFHAPFMLYMHVCVPV